MMLAGIYAGAAAAGIPALKHTPAGMKTAVSSLLTLKDLGRGWTAQKATSSTGIRLSCNGFPVSGAGVVEIGSAESPSFKGGTTGPFVLQQTSVYETTKDANTWWNRGVKPGLITCVAQSLAPLAAQGIKVTITSQGKLPMASVGDRLAAYRVVATLSTTNGKRKTYFDVVLVQSGRTITEVSYSSLVKPVPANFEHAVALIFARRSGSAGPAA
jgi:hypothetical protein